MTLLNFFVQQKEANDPKNSMSIHLESGNLFYNFNTQKSFYDFLLNQQDEILTMMKLKSSLNILTKIQNICFTGLIPI